MTVVIVVFGILFLVLAVYVFVSTKDDDKPTPAPVLIPPKPTPGPRRFPRAQLLPRRAGQRPAFLSARGQRSVTLDYDSKLMIPIHHDFAQLDRIRSDSFLRVCHFKLGCRSRWRHVLTSEKSPIQAVF